MKYRIVTNNGKYRIQEWEDGKMDESHVVFYEEVEDVFWKDGQNVLDFQGKPQYCLRNEWPTYEAASEVLRSKIERDSKSFKKHTAGPWVPVEEKQ